MITSAQNTQVKKHHKIKSEGESTRREQKLFVAEGRKDVSGSPGESDRQDLCGRVYA